MDLLTLGKRIAYFRKKIGIKQKALAEAIGVTPNAVSFYEQGRRNPPIPTLMNIAQALHITTDELLGLDQPADKDENVMLCSYRNLSKLGRKKVLEIMSDLGEIPKYSSGKTAKCTPVRTFPL